MTNNERNILTEWIKKEKNNFIGNFNSKGVLTYKPNTPNELTGEINSRHYYSETGEIKPTYNWLATGGKDLILNIYFWGSIEESLTKMIDTIKKLQIERQEALGLHPDPRISSIASALAKIDESEYNQLVKDYCEEKTLSSGKIIFVLKGTKDIPDFNTFTDDPTEYMKLYRPHLFPKHNP